MAKERDLIKTRPSPTIRRESYIIISGLNLEQLLDKAQSMIKSFNNKYNTNKSLADCIVNKRFNDARLNLVDIIDNVKYKKQLESYRYFLKYQLESNALNIKVNTSIKKLIRKLNENEHRKNRLKDKYGPLADLIVEMKENKIMNYKEITDALLNMSDQALDKTAKEMIAKWGEKPTALSILHTLDMCVHGSLCSGFCINVMDVMLKEAIKEENTSMEELNKQAHWRNKF